MRISSWTLTLLVNSIQKMQSRESSHAREIKLPPKRSEKNFHKELSRITSYRLLLYILCFNYNYRCEINVVRIIYEAKKKAKKLAGCWAPDINILVNVSGLRYSKQIEFQEELINLLIENLTSLRIFTLNIKQFLWKYHILPTLFYKNIFKITFN